MLAGGAFQQRAIDLDRQRLRQQAGEDGFLVRLEFVDRAAQVVGLAFRGGGTGMICCSVTTCEITDWKRL